MEDKKNPVNLGKSKECNANVAKRNMSHKYITSTEPVLHNKSPTPIVLYLPTLGKRVINKNALTRTYCFKIACAADRNNLSCLLTLGPHRAVHGRYATSAVLANHATTLVGVVMYSTRSYIVGVVSRYAYVGGGGAQLTGDEIINYKLIPSEKHISNANLLTAQNNEK